MTQAQLAPKMTNHVVKNCRTGLSCAAKFKCGDIFFVVIYL